MKHSTAFPLFVAFGFLVALGLSVFMDSCSETPEEEQTNSGSNTTYTPVEEVENPVLPAWEEGVLDIHFINTGRGECTYMIMPDGTTFLTDASGSLYSHDPDADIIYFPAKPSEDYSSGFVITSYIKHFAPAVSKGHINYFLLTHHHEDHGGMVNSSLPYYDAGGFYLSSLCEIGTNLVIDKMFDRDYPNFNYPRIEENSFMTNYKAFINWTQSANNTQVEQWVVGSNTQVVPIHDPACGVSVRNYAGSGYFWTGEADEESFTYMPDFSTGALDPGDNCFSCAYILSYGDFDVFMGGDLQWFVRDRYSYCDTETPLLRSIHKKVEAMKANHHGSSHTADPDLMAVLQPDVWFVGSWTSTQPEPETVDYVLGANPDCNIFCINLWEDNEKLLGEERMNSINANGHFVIRVAEGGKSFMTYMLYDDDFKYRIKYSNGPYYCTE